MNGIQFSSFIAIIAGIIIFIFPDILQILLAVLLIVIGINGLIFGSKVNKAIKLKINK